MKRVFFFLVILFAIPVEVLAQPSVAMARPQKGFGNVDDQIKRVAITEVVDSQGNVDPGLKLAVRSSITTGINLVENYQAFERVNISAMFKELDFQRTGYIKDDQIHKIGDMTGASYILIPELARLFSDENYVLTARIIDVVTGLVTESAETYIEKNLESVQNGARELALKLLGVSRGGSSSAAKILSISISSSKSDYIESAYGINMEMVYVKGGEFLMGGTTEQGGDVESDEQVIRRVNVGDFYIGRFEVTQSQWESVMGTSVSQQRDKANPQWSLRGTGPNNPMYYVSWEEASEFCRILSRKTGRSYRLPTEAEWEYAARGGQKSEGTKYSGSNIVDYAGWYGNSAGSTHPVGTKNPNELGIYDMSGNVWEWCRDWYAGAYDRSQTDNPTGPVSSSSRVLRGGSWHSTASFCRVSNRNGNPPGNRYYDSGFRVVCLP